MRHRFYSLIVVLLGCLSVVTAQSDDCPALVEEALSQVDTLCENADRNQACYGNFALTAEPQPGIDTFTFEQAGDIVDVTDIQTMILSEMDETAGVWGVALMRLQADIPDSMPGQNVTFLLFGDVTITASDAETDSPMQAFYLQTGIGDSRCTEAPDSGLLIQTPDGVEEVTFNINGADVSVGSTVLFQAQPENEMTISPVEGSAIMTLDDTLYPAIAGTQLRVPLGDDLRPAGPPPLPEAYRERDISGLPVHLLERRIEMSAPLDGDRIAEFQERLQQGDLPCGDDDGLPACERLERLRERGASLPGRSNWGDTRLERFPDLGDARVLADGLIRLGSGDTCQPDNSADSDVPGCNRLDLPDGLTLEMLQNARDTVEQHRQNRRGQLFDRLSDRRQEDDPQDRPRIDPPDRPGQ